MNHDCDDISLPTKLERLTAYLERYPAIAAAGCFAEYINTAGVVIGAPPIHWNPKAIRRTFGKVNSMIISATLARRELYTAVAPFKGEFKGCDDYDFWTRALLAGFSLANIPEILHKIRIHPESMGATKAEEMKMLAGRISRNYRRARRRNMFRVFFGR